EQFGKSKIIRELSQERHFPPLSTAPFTRVFLAENCSLNRQSCTLDPTARWTVHSSDRNASSRTNLQVFWIFKGNNNGSGAKAPSPEVRSSLLQCCVPRVLRAQPRATAILEFRGDSPEGSPRPKKQNAIRHAAKDLRGFHPLKWDPWNTQARLCGLPPARRDHARNGSTSTKHE